MRVALPFVMIVATTLSACSTVKTNVIKTNSSPAAPTSVHIDGNVNKQLVADFFELAFNRHQPADAAAKYLAPQYIQHNPGAPDGAQTFVAFFEGFFQTHPTAQVQIKRMLVDGDLVAVHARWTQDQTDLGNAVVDIFRIANDRIVEHWDVVQPVPEQSFNSNTMF